MADINLIPQEVRKEQAKKAVIKSSTVISIILLVITILISIFLFVRSYNVKNKIKVINMNIESLRGDINGMASIEVSGRNLDQKYTTLKGILDSRDRASLLLREFKHRLPSTITLDSFGTGKNSTLNISGYGADYISIAQFVNNLANRSYPGAAKGYEGLFKEVSLNSVNLDAQTSQARFFIVITLDGELLKK